MLGSSLFDQNCIKTTILSITYHLGPSWPEVRWDKIY